MSVVKSIELVLPPDTVYLAGSSVKGQVVLTLHSTLVDPVVRVELVGRGYVEWSEETGHSLDYSREILCNNKADYVHKIKTFPVPGNWLGAGSHRFDFRFNLPPRLPSSFSGRLGHVCYFLQASCLGREIVLAKKRVYLQVQATADTDTHSHLLQERPLSASAEKKVSYHCCGRGWVRLQLWLEQSTFRPGETLSFTAEVQNRTARAIRAVVAVLVAHVSYQGFTPSAERRSRADSTQLLRREAPGPIAPFSTGRVGATLSLPTVLALSGPGPNQNDLMSTHYELLSSVRLPWSLSSVKAALPIFIVGHSPEASLEEEEDPTSPED
ncbi:arrestin domain-containing protein 5 [Erinaceus europaeus]|uniref:Arrestin domain-containing protein 5 n=1 Tax=Erinaceus europaeus TaxID=9365 RepID=A0A1S2ZV26_ERIEU|nr:arrestin domain-containing protein 5 [Erinaceus europaeus]